MAKIQSKLNADQYQTLDDFMADLHLMFDNACRYNEPDSQVYKVSTAIPYHCISQHIHTSHQDTATIPLMYLLRKFCEKSFDIIFSLQHLTLTLKCA